MEYRVCSLWRLDSDGVLRMVQELGSGQFGEDHLDLAFLALLPRTSYEHRLSTERGAVRTYLVYERKHRQSDHPVPVEHPVGFLTRLLRSLQSWWFGQRRVMVDTTWMDDEEMDVLRVAAKIVLSAEAIQIFLGESEGLQLDIIRSRVFSAMLLDHLDQLKGGGAVFDAGVYTQLH